jgi:hypothetical protein
MGVPVRVSVGRRATWELGKLGPRVVGGHAAYLSIWSAAIVGAATPPVADAG